jgi:hypothetical protein
MSQASYKKFHTEDAAVFSILTLIREKFKQEFCESKRDELTQKLMGLYEIMSPSMYEFLSKCERKTLCDHFDNIMMAPIVIYRRHDDTPINYVKLRYYLGENWPAFKVEFDGAVDGPILASAIVHKIQKDEEEYARISRPLYNLWAHYREHSVGDLMCDEWKANFSVFREWAVANGFKPGMSMRRTDTSKQYAPDNTHFIEREIPNRESSPVGPLSILLEKYDVQPGEQNPFGEGK